MVMEKPSPLLVGREFVRQYYTLLNKAPDYLHRFYGRNSSYVHGGVDGSGQPEEAVYGQAEIHTKVMSLQFSECHTKIRHVDAHATLGDGVVVQVMGELSNGGRAMRRFMQTFVLAPEGSAVNKFYVHNDIFRYEEEVFGDSEVELAESEEEDVEEKQTETRVSPEPAQDRPASTTCYEPPPVSNGVEEQQEEMGLEAQPESQPEPQASQEAEVELSPDGEQQVAEAEPEEEEKLTEEEKHSTPDPVLTPPPQQTPEPPKAFSWASVTSKNLPPAGASVVSSHLLKTASVQPRVELKLDAQSALPRDHRRERSGFPPRGARADGGGSESQAGKQHMSFRGRGDPEAGDADGRRSVRYPDSHQLFVGNLPHDIDEGELKDFFMTFGNVVEMRINTKGVGGKLPNFGFVVFDDCEPVPRILGAKPIMFRGEVRLNVEEKKTRATRERDTRGAADGRRGLSGPRGSMGNGMGRDRDGRGPLSSRGGMGAGRGGGPSGESRFAGPRR
ncbi:ras GTPase-activating protein-binding protein 2-like [Triplophysa dalaica]|uniref:ras GTPase-activating protein-binding protein 2 n=1 Tax=Triplophysa dalaica TaxID=1582913 RepID=UPI0024DF47BD|nr:ras GTPase-activating protein-binding protein 2 [Triplophysa dalaica]XP_056598437.1 ras GTPase-activating protein-binding protein 2-like [Triplophysa dalaica]